MHYWAFWRLQQQQHEDDCYWGEISRKKETHNNSQTERDEKIMLEFSKFYNSNRTSATYQFIFSRLSFTYTTLLLIALRMLLCRQPHK